MNTLSPVIILSCIVGYFLLLILVSYFTGKDSGNKNFFLANRKSPWYVVAFGMIGASLSGVTFISVPGAVGAGGLNQSFSYMQIVFGYVLGYIVIANVLLPIYYKMNLTSIYEYLEKRFGFFAYKTGAGYFLLSRIIGASFRLFLVALVLHKFVLEPYGISFSLTVAITIILIWVYTFRGGIKTIVWTDTLQTTFMLVAVIWTIIAIKDALGTENSIYQIIKQSDYSQLFYFEGGWSDPNNFFKQFFSGALITIVMTGLDQDMMQKNLTCKTLDESKKNMYSLSFVLIFANILFLTLGALLYIYAANLGIDIPEKGDQLFPTIALQHLPAGLGILFVLGLIAAAYSSADSALTSLTTSFCVDFLNFEKRDDENQKKKTRIWVHVTFSFILLVVILVFNALSNDSVINELFRAAGYTYGPILGLFVYGISSKRELKNNWVIPVCLAAPILSYLIDSNSINWFNGFTLGFLILPLNGLLTILGLWLISKPKV